MKNTKPKPNDVKKRLFSVLVPQIELLGKKELTSNQESELEISLLRLREFSEIFANCPESLEHFLMYIEKVEGYTGKLRDSVLHSWGITLRFIPLHILKYENFNEGEPSGKAVAIIQRLIDFLLPRVSAKPATSKRVANARVEMWNVLAELSTFHPVVDVLEVSRKIATSEKHKEIERIGAIQCLLKFRDVDDEATETIISKLRDNPPNRDVFSDILRSDVDLGLVDEFTALIELEDSDEDEWDEGY